MRRGRRRRRERKRGGRERRFRRLDGTKDFKNMQCTGDSEARDKRARDERIKAHHIATRAWATSV